MTKVDEWTAVEKMINLGMDTNKSEDLFLPYNLNMEEERIVNSSLFS